MDDLRFKKGKKTKELILTTALNILFKDGRDGLTTRKLAQEANVSKGNIYHHFKNMDEILKEAFKYDINKTTELMLDFKYDSLESLISNFVINIITVFETKEQTCKTSHDPFLELISTNDEFASIIKELEASMRNWLISSMNKFIKNKLSEDLEVYLFDVIYLFIEGARTSLFFIKKDATSYKKTWKILSKHLVEKILEENK